MEPKNKPAKDTSKKQDSYRTELRKKFSAIIDTLHIDDLKKSYLRERWLEQLLWLDTKADENQKQYNLLRRISLIVGAIVPAMISLSLPEFSEWVSLALKIATIILSIVVAISTSIEQFYNFGVRWRHFRKATELMKSEGWAYLMLADRYESFKTHEKAFKSFAERAESIIQTDVNTYIAQVVKDSDKIQQG
jgi:hypothetical protein